MNVWKNRSLFFGLVLTGLIALLVLTGIVYTPYDPDAMDVSMKNLAPSLKHWFGTDNYGRDLLSRVMVGARTTFLVGFATVAIGGIFGTLVGLLTGYYGGVIDEIIMRINDGILAFPGILLALAFVGMFGPGEKNVVLALGILFIPSIARVVRGEVIRQRKLDYVTNARLMGASLPRILFVHILPNLRRTLLVTMAIGFNNAVLAEAGLSYLGLGVQPPAASLGRMLQEAQSCLRLAPWYAVVPGAVIVIAVLGVALISEGLSDGRTIPVTKKKTQAQGEKKNLSLSPDTILSVRNLTVSFPADEKDAKRTVVGGISFDLKRGETLGIVGESGSGKSMTAKAILGLLPENADVSGEICLAGTNPGNLCESEKDDERKEKENPCETQSVIDILSAPRELLRSLRSSEIAMVFQEPMTSLNPVKTIEKQMLEVSSAHKIRAAKEELHKRMEKALEEVDLTETGRILRSYPHQLSGGMRQRVMIAMAMLLRPRILLADEPTTALDAETQEEILTLISRLQKTHGMTVLFISHNLAVIRRLSDRVLVMEHGRIVEQGECEQIFSAPKQDFTKKLLHAANGEDFSAKMIVPKDAPVVVKVQHLHVYYGRKRHLSRGLGYQKEVLSDFSMTVQKGDVFGILGQSGTGKSTLARCLLGISGGKVAGTIETRGSVGMVFQDPYSSLNPQKTVGWLLEEPLRNRGIPFSERRTRMEEMLTAVGLLPEYASRKISALSGGERQRVAIGMALMARPEILILDEPVSALDVTVQEQVLSLLTELHNRYQLTYLFISHDEDVIRRMTTTSCRIDEKNKRR